MKDLRVRMIPPCFRMVSMAFSLALFMAAWYRNVGKMSSLPTFFDQSAVTRPRRVRGERMERGGEGKPRNFYGNAGADFALHVAVA